MSTARTDPYRAPGAGHHRSSPVMKLPRDLLMTSSAIPVYHRLAGHLRDLIVGGAFAAAEQLPPEQAIAEHLFVSRPTVRHALHQLSREHLLRRVHGRGTFVNEQRGISA